MNRISYLAVLAALSAPGVCTPLLANTTAKKPVAKKAPPAKPATQNQKSAAPAISSSRYLSLPDLKRLQAQRAREGKVGGLPVLQPLIDGLPLKGRDMRDLATNPPVISVHAKIAEVEAGVEASAVSMNGERLAQAFPVGGVAPAAVNRTPRRPVTPRWVRYPLEFQLGGIGLGTKAVDKDRFNRIDRYGLFAIHGNPTAVVVPTTIGQSVAVTQQPPEVAALFPDSPDGGLPDWASAVMVQLDNNHVQWLYRRDNYSMGFVVDRLGYVDAIVVAGIDSPITRTQLEDPVHTIKLGDDLRKVLFRYGYPDSIETYTINAASGVSAGEVVQQAAMEGARQGVQAERRGQRDSVETGEAAGRSAAQAVGGIANDLYRTFEIRYEQSYNVIFTIRNNRVVRIYIFGDPDFFNEQRRNALRTSY